MLNHEAEIMTIANRFTETNLKAKLAYEALNNLLFADNGIFTHEDMTKLHEFKKHIDTLQDKTNYYSMKTYIDEHLKTLA